MSAGKTISTIVVIICLLIIGVYVMGEVNYFANKNAVESNIEAPTIVIPKIGVTEKINEISLDQGVLHEKSSYNPTVGDVLIFGHRTLEGSPFLRLNELSQGDTILLEWPGIGEVKYNVIDKTVVPATYQLSANPGGNKLYLITCDPIGSTENRLIITGELVETNPINSEIINSNPQGLNSWIFTAIFLVFGLILARIYPKEDRNYILATVLIITAVLVFCCIHPLPPEIIFDKINFLNGGL